MTLLEQLCEIAALQRLQQQHPPKSTKVTNMYPGGPGAVHQTTKQMSQEASFVGQGTTLPQDMDPNRFRGSSGFCGSTAQVTRAGNRGKDVTPTVATCIVCIVGPGPQQWRGSTTKHSACRSQDGHRESVKSRLKFLANQMDSQQLKNCINFIKSHVSFKCLAWTNQVFPRFSHDFPGSGQPNLRPFQEPKTGIGAAME